MKQVGNLAIVCAQRKDVLFQVLNGNVTVYIGSGPQRTMLRMRWNDDAEADKIIYALNHGEHQEKAA